MYSLARELHMTVQFLAKNMTQGELAHWMAYFKMQEAEREEKTCVTVAPEQSADDTMVDILMAHARG